MVKNKKTLTFILNSILIFSCSVEKPITNNNQVVSTQEKTNSKTYEDIKLAYPDFKESNLELPDKLILQRTSYLEIIDKKGNIQKTIPIERIADLKLVKEKNIIIFSENNEKIRIINYETGKEDIILFDKKNLKNSTMIYSSEGEIYFIFVKKEKEKEKEKNILCTSDLKGNIKELSEIDNSYNEKFYYLYKDNKKVSFFSNGDIYTINIDGSNKFKLLEKGKDNTGIKFDNIKFSPNNEYLAYTKFNSYGNPNETYVIKSDTFTRESKYTSENFVGYGDSLEWIDNESFSFNSLEYKYKKYVSVTIKNLNNKLTFTESDNTDENKIVVPKDYTLFSKSKSYNNEKIAYKLLFQYSEICLLPAYSISSLIKYIDPFENSACNPYASSAELHISDSDGKNDINILQVGGLYSNPIRSLDTFVWSSDSKYLFVAINNGLYIYNVEKNQFFTIGKYDKKISEILY